MKGFTLLEILISISILFLLASVVQPIAKISIKKNREIRLQRSLRILRTAIDEFKKDWDDKLINHIEGDYANEETGYPKTLEALTEKVKLTGPKDKYKRYLRRIPENPFKDSVETGPGWGLRCFRDPPDIKSWCGDDVYDIYADTYKTAIDQTYYSDW